MTDVDCLARRPIPARTTGIAIGAALVTSIRFIASPRPASARDERSRQLSVPGGLHRRHSFPPPAAAGAQREAFAAK
jgi:hypothetical protein